MDNHTDSPANNLANNVIDLRKKQRLSQEQLAKKANIPRSTLTYIESGDSNPSLSNLVKLSSALQVSLEELISSPHAQTRLVKAKDIIVKRASRGQVEVKKLLPDPIPGMEIDHLSISPGGRMKGTPHINHTREYLYCAAGHINVYVEKAKYQLSVGDLLVFPGDEPHAYENASQSKKAIGFSVVTFAHKGL